MPMVNFQQAFSIISDWMWKTDARISALEASALEATELLKELLGHFYVTDDGNICWGHNECVDGLRDVGESPKVIEALVKRRKELLDNF